MPARSPSATACSSGSAPIRRCCSTRCGDGRRSPAFPPASCVSVALAVVIGMPTFRLTGHYFSMATIAVAELIRIFVGTWTLVGAAIGLQGPATARGWWDLTFRSELPYYYIFLAVLARRARASPPRSSAAASAFICARSRRASAPRAASACRCGKPKCRRWRCSAAFTSVAGSLYAHQDRLHRSRQRLRHSRLGADGHCRGTWAAPARCSVRCSARSSSCRCRPRPTPGSAAAARA